MNEAEKERLIKKDIKSIENRVRHAFNQGYEMGVKESRSEIPNTCEDTISRQAVIDIITFEDKWLFDANGHNANTHIAFSGLESRVKALPSVTPQQKMGRWIKYGIPRCGEQHYQCTSCEYYINFGQWGELYTKEFKFCPNCGAKMVEPQESEV